MADERAAQQRDTGEPEEAISQPHDKYFQRVLSNERDAASLLRTCVPQPLADTLKWSTLTVVPGRFAQPEVFRGIVEERTGARRRVDELRGGIARARPPGR